MGFPDAKTRTHPISHPTLVSQIAWDRIRVKPGIERFEGDHVYFVDGSSEVMDSIIAATGYVTDIPFLAKEVSPLTGTRLDLYNRVIHPQFQDLYFIGFFDVSGGSNIRMMDTQAEYIAAAACGLLRLPNPAGMQKAIEADHAWQNKQFPNSARYGLELDPMRFRKLLSRDYARSGISRPSAVPASIRPNKVVFKSQKELLQS